MKCGQASEIGEGRGKGQKVRGNVIFDRDKGKLSRNVNEDTNTQQRHRQWKDLEKFWAGIWVDETAMPMTLWMAKIGIRLKE